MEHVHIQRCLVSAALTARALMGQNCEESKVLLQELEVTKVLHVNRAKILDSVDLSCYFRHEIRVVTLAPI